MHEIDNYPTETDPEVLKKAQDILDSMHTEITYWGEIDYGRCQSIEIPMHMLGDLLTKHPYEIKEIIGKWYAHGQKTDKERETEQKGQC